MRAGDHGEQIEHFGRSVSERERPRVGVDVDGGLVAVEPDPCGAHQLHQGVPDLRAGDRHRQRVRGERLHRHRATGVLAGELVGDEEGGLERRGRAFERGRGHQHQHPTRLHLTDPAVQVGGPVEGVELAGHPGIECGLQSRQRGGVQSGAQGDHQGVIADPAGRTAVHPPRPDIDTGDITRHHLHPGQRRRAGSHPDLFRGAPAAQHPQRRQPEAAGERPVDQHHPVLTRQHSA